MRFFQASILEWVAISFSRGSSQPRDWTQVSCVAGRFFYRLGYKGSPHKSRMTQPYIGHIYSAQREDSVQRNSKKNRKHNFLSLHCCRPLSKKKKKFKILKRAQVVRRSSVKSQIPSFSVNNISVLQFPHKSNGTKIAAPFTSGCYWGQLTKLGIWTCFLTITEKTNVEQ